MIKKSFILAVLIVSLFSPLISLAPVSPDISPNSPPINQKVSSEEENIDSFDVSPNSGRWNVTNNLITDDRIVDSNLRLITVNNDTTDSAGYEMDRGMRKTDGKVEYRSKADGGGNNSEYFRDQRADSKDFEEGDLEGLGGLSSMTANNGIFSANFPVVSADFLTGVIPSGVPTDIYHTFQIRMKTNQEGEESGLFFRAITALGGSIIGGNILLTTEWTVFEVDLSADADWVTVREEGMTLRFDDNDDGTLEAEEFIFIDWIKLIGDLDFATHVESEVEDTWDWEDSKEYWFNVESNISDFEDGTTEDWFALGGSTAVASNVGWLNITNTLDTDQETIYTGFPTNNLSVDSSIYKWMTIEFFSTFGTVDTITISDIEGNFLVRDTTNHAINTYWLFSEDLSGANWSGTELGFQIQVNWTATSPSNQLDMNMTFLNDVELGDNEGWATTSGQYKFGHPEGFENIRRTAEDGLFGIQRSSLNIDPTLFNFLKIRVKGAGQETNFRFFYRDQDSVDHLVTLLAGELSSSFTEFTVDLTTESDWTSSTKIITLFFYWATSSFANIFVDYILLTGHWDSADSVIGLYDSNLDAPLLNVTTHFYDQPNDPNFPNSTTLRFEIELMDSDGDIAYQFLSNNFTTLSDEYINGKIQYDVLRSKLTIEIKDKDFTRLFRIVYPEDYNEISGRIPALFNLGIAPSVFISTSTQATSWQEMAVDYIRAPFKEKTWFQTDIPTDPEFTEDQPFFAEAVDDVDDTSAWRLVVPSLDAVSALIKINTSDNDLWDSCAVAACISEVSTVFTVYNSDLTTGTANNLVSIEVAMKTNNTINPAARGFTHITIKEKGVIVEEFFKLYPATFPGGNEIVFSPQVQFSIALQGENRDIINTRANIFSDKEDGNSSVFVSSYDISDGFSSQSQEFILETKQTMDYTALVSGGVSENVIAKIIIDDFSFTDRDIFSGLVDGVNNFIGGAQDVVSGGGNIVTDIAKEIGKFIGGIFKLVGDSIVFAVNTGLSLLTTAVNLVTTAVNLVTAAIVQIGTDITNGLTALGTAIINGLDTAFTTIINGLETALETALGLIETAVDAVTTAVDSAVGFLTDIWGVIETFITDLLDDMLTWIEDEFFPGIITFMFTLWDDIWTPILNLVGMKAFVDGIVQQDFTTFLSDFVSLFGVLANNLKWVIAGLIFFIFTLSFMQARESNGRINGMKGLGNMINHGFKTGYHTPDTSLLGFSLGRIFIPLIIIVYIALKVLIAAGTLPDIFGGLPI